MKLELGGIFRTEWEERPFRIIGLDNLEVFYDCLWPHDNKWTFSGNFKRQCFLYRTSLPLFEQKSQRIDFLPLTEQEQRAFRPDLPIRIGRMKELSWNNINESDFSSFAKSVKANIQEQKLQTGKVVLLPYGDKGGLKKGVVISADNSTYFNGAELLWKAKEIQKVVNDNVSDGVGLYRIGYEKGLPSYYIGKYLDKAGLLKD